MRMLYIRQTKNELTGEHSAIMVRALPKTSGVDDKWLDAFVADTKRRFIALLGGAFRDMEIKLAISALEEMDDVANEKVADRTAAGYGKITAEELSYHLTPHDLKRLELYGRNLCDHHLVTDLLPCVAKLYFTGRFGPDMKLSSVQAAILCGIGVQNRDVDAITNELGLPSNQVLAMFNKAVRKMSIALNAFVEENEEQGLLGGEKRIKISKTFEKMRDVAEKTLEEDAAEAAKDAMEVFNSEKALPPEIANDDSLMQYAIRGSDEQWNQALEGKGLNEAGTVSIKSVREKRKVVDADDYEHEAKHEPSGASKSSRSNKKTKVKGRGRVQQV